MNTQSNVSRYGTNGRMAVCVSASTCWAASTSAVPSVAVNQGAQIADVERGLVAVEPDIGRVAGAIKTDFILSAEIMTIALAQITSDSLWVTGSALALVAIGITALVYGSVAILVKADDVGLRMAQVGRGPVTRALGVGIVKAMPTVLALISAIGTAAILWIGGSIVIHGPEVLGCGAISHHIHNLARVSVEMVGAAGPAVEWTVTAALDGIFGLALGLATIPLIKYLQAPAASLISSRKD